MNIEYTLKHQSLFAQAYGSSTYGGQTYSCPTSDTTCTTGTTTETAPNTGFFGLSQDAAIASGAGALSLRLQSWVRSLLSFRDDVQIRRILRSNRMSLLSYLGLDDLADGIREFTDGFDELKQEVLSSVIGPGEELKTPLVTLLSQ